MNDFLAGLAQWTEFDKEVFGGNYQGHSSDRVETSISMVPGMEGHPLFRNVSIEGFSTTDFLYWNQFLQSENAQVLLVGGQSGEQPQPLLWTNNNGRNKVIYTSLGSVDDFKNEKFRQMMKNSITFLLNKSLGLDQTVPIKN